MAPTCLRCGPLSAPIATVEVWPEVGDSYHLCLRCMVERERIEPTARKGGAPAMPIRAGSRQVNLGGGK